MHLDTFFALKLALLVKIRLKAKTNETFFAFTTKDDHLHLTLPLQSDNCLFQSVHIWEFIIVPVNLHCLIYFWDEDKCLCLNQTYFSLIRISKFHFLCVAKVKKVSQTSQHFSSPPGFERNESLIWHSSNCLEFEFPSKFFQCKKQFLIRSKLS